MNTSELKTAAHAAWDEDNEQDAEALFKQALAIDGQDPQTLFDLALLYKFQDRWAEALDFNRKVVAIKPDDTAAWWNLGIAATALSDWTSAAQAWQVFDITLPLESLPPALPAAAAAVRVRNGKQIDVLLGERLDPARVRVTQVPLPDCGVRYGDILLNDGLGNGVVTHQGIELPVREVLSTWAVSNHATYVLEAVVESKAQLDTLVELAARAGLPLQDWGGKVRYVLPTEGKHAPAEPEWQKVREIGIAAEDDQPVADLLDAWLAACPEVDIREVYVALTPDDAGEAHA
ncbi:tetratricopeptide repeat protein [Chitinilyticum litopenaei]|uniref:Tetratricopeptide repeat protein n=2 Tax=Chitinilyticum piscinae TaxID=2866724 RepID=A0A8J7FI49_9NEIS|nr:tetratricopeptide repeat protein [Chitinilyticum piscinae]